MVKAIAYYLPQFHEIPENDAWWGKGFTEWTNLRKAKPLFKGHKIPEPLDDNYYNLMDKDTVIWQTKLANENGIYAFNYYHYWFKGRKILEKPAENLLAWKDIPQRFMFMWANHNWTRSWIGKNEVLIKLDYGDENDWNEHIEYLMQFFLDDRYVKIGNKPVFQIYVRKRIPYFEKMISIWDSACRKNGFDGIFIIDNVEYGMIQRKDFSPACNAITLQEHTASLQFWIHKNIFRRINEGLQSRFWRLSSRIPGVRRCISPASVKVYNYEKIAKASIELMKKLRVEKKVFFGICTGWDNTPRYGKRGYIVDGATPANFKEYIQKAKTLSEEKDQELIFIACWNEWCEGMVLEPTKADGFGYLDAIKEVFSNNDANRSIE